MSNSSFTKVTDRAGRIQNVIESNKIVTSKLVSAEVNLALQNWENQALAITGPSSTVTGTIGGGLSGGDLWVDLTGYVRMILF